MNDCEQLMRVSGASGGLAEAVSVCGEINNGCTAVLDRMFGSDMTDGFDASCNTCVHFRRRAMTLEEKRERNIFGMPGRCEVKDVDVRGWQRGQYCGFENAECYVNRRSGLTHQGSVDGMWLALRQVEA